MGRFGKRTVLSAVASGAVIALPCAALASASGPRAVENSSRDTAVTTSAADTTKATPDQTISYHGYQLRVPASWPVYHLGHDPSRCVLFNRHAVYLGRPGTNQRCPAHAFGKTEAVLVQPMGSAGNLPAGTVMERGRRAGGWSAGPLAAGNATAHVMRLALPAADVLVTATYGKDRPLVSGMLNGARLTPAAAPAHRAARHSSRHGSGLSRAARRGADRSRAARHDPARHQDSRYRGSPQHAAAANLNAAPASNPDRSAGRRPGLRHLHRPLGGDDDQVADLAVPGGDHLPRGRELGLRLRQLHQLLGQQGGRRGLAVHPALGRTPGTVLDDSRGHPDQSISGAGGGILGGGRRGGLRGALRVRDRHPDLLRHGGLQQHRQRLQAGRALVPGRLDAGPAQPALPVRRLQQRGQRHHRPGLGGRQPRLRIAQ